LILPPNPERAWMARFSYNTVWYYTVLVCHFLFESFKEDVVVSPVITAKCSGWQTELINRILILN